MKNEKYFMAVAMVVLAVGQGKALEYTNPIIHADYSDPDACRWGEAYYMTASSFNCAPGLPILKSEDLVNWQIVNYALDAVPPLDYYDAAPRHGKGVWAPSIREHDGEIYIYWGDPDFGIYMVKTSDPEGQWEEPVLVVPGRGMIDPCPLWDDDGRVWLVNGWAGSRAGFNSVLTMRELSTDGTRSISQPVMVYDGNDGVNHTVEGPKLYKRDGYYYIFAPAGGVATGWQLAMRSSDILGPYESKIVMAQGDSPINGPHQGAWVETPQGEDWFIHFQDKGAYGRVLHLQPMAWHDGWPVIGIDTDGDGCGQPVTKHAFPTLPNAQKQQKVNIVDNFDTPSLGHDWEWHANYHQEYGFPTQMGFFRLYSHQLSPEFVNMWEVPNMLLQKYPAEKFTATTKIKMGAKGDDSCSRAGLISMGWDYCALVLEKDGEDFAIKRITCIDAEQGNPETVETIATLPASRIYEAGAQPNYERDLWLRMDVKPGAIAQFSYSADGKKFIPAGEPFQARAGKWIGAKVGFVATSPQGSPKAWLDIDQFTLQERQ